ncbi:MAG: DUF3500 domain-containing protein [Pedosphaera sp.]|nr:DUF3500 domain-containing protein [Pedosphaera sp.]
MTDAAKNFLAALTPEQKAKATFALTNSERINFHFIPRPRNGLPFKEMTPAQRLLGLALLNSALSQRGYLKAATIMSLDEILRAVEQGRGPTRDSELYFVSVFGQPGASAPWGWRVEGHHLALNFLLVGEHIATTPSFFGTNPAEVRDGPRAGLSVLGREEDLGRQLVQSLTAEQRALAIITNVAPKEIVTGTNRTVTALTPVGLSAAKLDHAQSALLHQIVEEFARRYRVEFADAELKKIAHDGDGKLFFAWAGGLAAGEGHYYRVQGAGFLLEFDNTQNNANHIHTVWRDFANDFGDDMLKRHYEQTPHGK